MFLNEHDTPPPPPPPQFPDIIFKYIFLNEKKIYKFQLKFHWSLFLRVQLSIFQHWFRWWLGACQATSHYLNHWCLIYWRIYASLGLNLLKKADNKIKQILLSCPLFQSFLQIRHVIQLGWLDFVQKCNNLKVDIMIWFCTIEIVVMWFSKGWV